MVTEKHGFAYNGNQGSGAFAGALLHDMAFDRFNAGTRFAVADSGVFYTLDGVSWHRLVSATALPGIPVGATFDPVSDGRGASLYIAIDGRWVLRVFGPLPSATAENRCNTLRRTAERLEKELAAALAAGFSVFEIASLSAARSIAGARLYSCEHPPPGDPALVSGNRCRRP